MALLLVGRDVANGAPKPLEGLVSSLVEKVSQEGTIHSGAAEALPFVNFNRTITATIVIFFQPYLGVSLLHHWTFNTAQQYF